MTLQLDLDPALVARAEAQAAHEGTTLARLVERMIERRLADVGGANGARARGAEDEQAARPDSPVQRAVPPLPIFRSIADTAREIDWTSNASIYAFMYEEEDEKHLRFFRGQLPWE